MKTNLPRRRRIRLAAPIYAGPGGICSVTIAVRDLRPVFAKQEIATAAVETLRTLANKRRVSIYAYCVMPDHVHLLLAASAGCDIVTFVGRAGLVSDWREYPHSGSLVFDARSDDWAM